MKLPLGIIFSVRLDSRGKKFGSCLASPNPSCNTGARVRGNFILIQPALRRLAKKKKKKKKKKGEAEKRGGEEKAGLAI